MENKIIKVIKDDFEQYKEIFKQLYPWCWEQMYHNEIHFNGRFILVDEDETTKYYRIAYIPATGTKLKQYEKATKFILESKWRNYETK